ncbi:MAG: MFS transporter [Candidatus Baltobacteraceae bacterium]
MQRRTPDAARLGVFWFGVQAVWAALLGVSMQARSAQIAPGWELGAYALLASSGAIAAGFTQIGAGFASDRLRTRAPFYAAGTLVASAAIFWFYTAASYAQLFAAVLFVQIGMNLAVGPYQAVIPDFVTDERAGAASSWMAGLQSAGNAAGAIAASLVANARAVAALLIAGLLITCAVTATYTQGLKPPALQPQDRLPANRAYVDLFLSRTLMYVGFYTLLGYVFFFMQEVLGKPAARSQTGYLLLIVTAAGAAGAALCARAADRWDRRALVSIGGGIFAASIALLVTRQTWPGMALAAALAGGGWGIFLTADWALGCRFVPRAHAATALGVWNLALLLAQVAAPTLATLAIGCLPGLQNNFAGRIAFVLSCVEVLGGVAWIWRLPGLPLPL